MSRKRRQPIKNKTQVVDKQSKKTYDSFSNLLARMGSGTQSLLEGTEYGIINITKDVYLLNSLYREHWLVKKIVNTIPQDMLKSWYKINSQLSPDNLLKFKKLERTTQLRSKLLEGLQWARLYGGAAGIIIIDGHEDILDEPLELEDIMPDSFKGLIILDRHSGISPMTELVMDISDPDFGLPKYYTVQYEPLGNGIVVHHSRIIRFIGRELPYIDKVSEMYWGTSEIEHIFDELKKRDNTSWNVAMLVFRANVNTMKVEGMEEIALMDNESLEDMYKTLTLYNQMISNQTMLLLGKNDSLESHQFAFNGLSDVMEMFMLDVAGAAEMPVTKLFGRSPAGMNATGESDMENYYGHIEEEQESDLRPAIDKLLPIMAMSILGAIPDDLDYEFNPCRRPSEEERKTLAGQVSSSIINAFDSGIISRHMALKELKQSYDATGMWNSITDEDIENADKKTGFAGEDLPHDLDFNITGDDYGQKEE